MTASKATLAGTIENRSDAAKSYNLRFEFLDKSGNVVGTKEVAVASRQLATMVDAGLPLMRALTVLAGLVHFCFGLPILAAFLIYVPLGYKVDRIFWE